MISLHPLIIAAVWRSSLLQTPPRILHNLRTLLDKQPPLIAKDPAYVTLRDAWADWDKGLSCSKRHESRHPIVQEVAGPYYGQQSQAQPMAALHQSGGLQLEDGSGYFPYPRSAPGGAHLAQETFLMRAGPSPASLDFVAPAPQLADPWGAAESSARGAMTEPSFQGVAASPFQSPFSSQVLLCLLQLEKE